VNSSQGYCPRIAGRNTVIKIGCFLDSLKKLCQLTEGTTLTGRESLEETQLLRLVVS
jgi:hypothetical protein